MSRQHLKLEQWRQLIEQQQASGESVTVFCRRHGVHPKSFWNRRKVLRDAEQACQMIPVAPPVALPSGSQLLLSWQGIELGLSGAPSARWVAQLMRELSNASVA